jgi:type IV pilus assembly protein PilP
MNKITLLILLSFFITACDNKKDLSKKNISEIVLDIRSDSYSIAEDITKFNTYESVNYEAFDKKSPFEKVFDKKTVNSRENTIKPDLKRKKEHLEQFDISQLRINGIIDNKNQRVVIIFDGKRNYIVKSGDRMGKNFGKIIGITESSILLEEIVKEDGINSWLKKEVEINMTNNIINSQKN